MRKIGKSSYGFITLLATLILGAVALTVAITLLAVGISATKNNLALERSVQARALASGCAEKALRLIRADENFVGTQTLPVGTGNCTYNVTNTGPGAKNLAASALVDQISRKLLISLTVSSSTITIGSWQEVP